MIMYYIILNGTAVNEITTAILAFGINSGAYVAEIIRSGIMSIDRGQMEAGRSLGLSRRTTMVKIIFPQALKNVLPAIGNEFIALLKETSVAGYIGIQDLTKGGDIIRSITYQAFTPLLSTAAIYLVIVVGLSALLTKFERRLRRSDYR
jgi:arginine/lysine/histidine transport system permease protein